MRGERGEGRKGDAKAAEKDRSPPVNRRALRWKNRATILNAAVLSFKFPGSNDGFVRSDRR